MVEKFFLVLDSHRERIPLVSEIRSPLERLFAVRASELALLRRLVRGIMKLYIEGDACVYFHFRDS